MEKIQGVTDLSLFITLGYYTTQWIPVPTLSMTSRRPRGKLMPHKPPPLGFSPSQTASVHDCGAFLATTGGAICQCWWGVTNDKDLGHLYYQSIT